MRVWIPECLPRNILSELLLIALVSSLERELLSRRYTTECPSYLQEAKASRSYSRYLGA